MGCCCGKSSNRVSDISNDAVIAPNKSILINDDYQEWRVLIDQLKNNGMLNKYAFDKKRNQFRDVNEVIDYFKGSPAKNEIEKAWLIYFWICENIVYDAEGFRTNNYSLNDSDSVFNEGKAVCEGYSNIFLHLCKGLGIECKKIIGYAKGFGFDIGKKFDESNHAWNAIKINNKWRYVESTWGAGSVSFDFKFTKRFKPHYFLTPADIFIFTHFSDQDQDQATRMSLKEFEK